MDEQNSLKNNNKNYIPSRFELVDAVEWAADRMAAQLDNYVLVNERGPINIIVKSNKYSPFLCLFRLQGEINSMKLTSKISFSDKPVLENNINNLVLDLDLIADQYFEQKNCNENIYR